MDTNNTGMIVGEEYRLREREREASHCACLPACCRLLLGLSLLFRNLPKWVNCSVWFVRSLVLSFVRWSVFDIYHNRGGGAWATTSPGVEPFLLAWLAW